MKLKPKEVDALKKWAKESYRPNGCTAYGPLFDKVMAIAQRIEKGK